MMRLPLRLDQLEAREVPAVVEPLLQAAVEGAVGPPLRELPVGRVAVASGPGQVIQVHVHDAATGDRIGTVTPFGGYTHGARVATVDLTGDAVEDVIVALGPGAAPWLRVFDGATLSQVREFLAYSESFRGGVFVAAGDVTGDGRADVVTGAGPGGGPHVRAFDGAKLFENTDPQPTAHQELFAYSADFRGGVSVAVGDVDGDGVGDVVTGAGPGGGPHVKAFRASDSGLLAGYFAYDPAMTRGVFVAAGDTNGDGRAEIATAPMTGGGPHVRLFRDGIPVAEHVPFDAGQRAGARVALRDLDGDGRAEVIAATGPGVASQVRVMDGGEVRDFTALPADWIGGLSIA
jgi:hypothetical protein